MSVQVNFGVAILTISFPQLEFMFGTPAVSNRHIWEPGAPHLWLPSFGITGGVAGSGTTGEFPSIPNFSSISLPFPSFLGSLPSAVCDNSWGHSRGAGQLSSAVLTFELNPALPKAWLLFQHMSWSISVIKPGLFMGSEGGTHF